MLLRELKKIICSVTFLILLLAMVVMTYSQDALDFSDEKLVQPLPGQNYGNTNKDNPEVIIPAALKSLYQEFGMNQYTAYPIGFYKSVKLGEKQQDEMAALLSNLTGLTSQQLLEAAASSEPFDLSLKEGISYDAFKKYLQKADDLIGGGSSYASGSLLNFGSVPITYQEALAQYDLTKKTDHFTGGYARLFCDYILVGVLSILPVFLAVALCLKDKQAKMEAILFTNRVHSFLIIPIRYLALLIAIMIPAIILAYISNASVWALYPGEALDYLAPLKYALGWLLPTVMIITAVGMFLTELTNTPIAIVVVGLWWFGDINTGIRETLGYSLLRLAPRHNSLLRTKELLDNVNSLVVNRVFFAALSILVVVLTAIVYEQKRKGKLRASFKYKSFFNMLANRQNKSAA